MIIETWAQDDLEIEVVMVTEENLSEVAAWCKGRILKESTTNAKFIRVLVVRNSEFRDAKVRPGDRLAVIEDELWHFRDEDGIEEYFTKQEKS